MKTQLFYENHKRREDMASSIVTWPPASGSYPPPTPYTPTPRAPPHLPAPTPHVGLVGCGEALGGVGYSPHPRRGSRACRILEQNFSDFQSSRSLAPEASPVPKIKQQITFFSTSRLALTFPSEAQNSLRHALQRIFS